MTDEQQQEEAAGFMRIIRELLEQQVRLQEESTGLQKEILARLEEIAAAMPISDER